MQEPMNVKLPVSFVILILVLFWGEFISLWT